MLDVEISEKTKELLDFDISAPKDTHSFDELPKYRPVRKSTLVQKVTERFRKQKY